MNIDNRQTDDRPQGPFTHFGKISNGHNSATRQPIPFMFGSRVGFSGKADPTAPFSVGSNSRWRPAAILENFKRPYLKKIECLMTVPFCSFRISAQSYYKSGTNTSNDSAVPCTLNSLQEQKEVFTQMVRRQPGNVIAISGQTELD